MLRWCVCALAGAWLLSRCPVLPGAVTAGAGLLLALPCALWRPLRAVAALLAGALLLWAAAEGVMAERLPAEKAGIDISFDAEIIEINNTNTRVPVLLLAPDAAYGLPSRLRLGWYGAQASWQPGERWHLRARLRQPRGYANPGGFDYAGWLFRQRIGATGYVREGTRLVASSTPAFAVRLRRGFVARVERLLPDGDVRAVLLAVTAGTRHAITRDAWRRYATTGTSHLMAISGLHVGLAAGAAFLLGRLLCALALPRANARDVAVLVAMVAMVAYAGFSGFAIPAQRAVMMAAFAMVSVLARQRPRSGYILALACAGVVLVDPLAVLAPGFVLSFAAVAILLQVGQRTRCLSAQAGWRSFGHSLDAGRLLATVQVSLLLGLFMVSAMLFGRFAWLAPVANMLVLPVFSFVTVPAALLGVLLGGPLACAGDLALWLAWHSLRLVLSIIDILARLPGATLSLAAPQGAALAGFALTGLWIILPPGWPGRALAWPALLWAVLYRPGAPDPDCTDIQALDVGQGLAAVVRTHAHTLVFDTGPAFQSGSDTAGLVVLPYLQSIGVHAIDVLVISHNDLDHAGGIDTLHGGIDIGRTLYGEPSPQQVRHQGLCQAGQHWQWDGIEFAILQPAAGDRRDGNNASCVLEVSAGPHRALLTGDIEMPAEQKLLARAVLRDVDVAFVPHHGSRTSSGTAFVNALGAEFALVSTGFRNRWGFPKADVVARWVSRGGVVINTADAGAVRFRMCRNDATRVYRQREVHRRFWQSAS